MNQVLEDIYRTGKCVDLAGKERKVTGAVPREDALILQEMVRFVKAETTLETGVAFGLSTIAICAALLEEMPNAERQTTNARTQTASSGETPNAERQTTNAQAQTAPSGETTVAERRTTNAQAQTAPYRETPNAERRTTNENSSDAPIDTRQSTLATNVKHYGVDPEQNTVHGGAALASLKRAGLDSVFELLEGPSHLMLPKLIEKGVVLDLAFIDGWHTFDYTLLDFFYIDKMLRPGGVVLLHDRSWPSKQKVIQFIRTHRRYKELPLRAGGSRLKWLRRVAAAKWHWLRGAPFGVVLSAIANRPEIAAFLKLESFEPDHRFYRNF